MFSLQTVLLRAEKKRNKRTEKRSGKQSKPFVSAKNVLIQFVVFVSFVKKLRYAKQWRVKVESAARTVQRHPTTLQLHVVSS
jgi:hypothetical protein